ncbi:MAG: ferrochelatase [Planctomycetes bacterium]|nr:ferrochelatase [Planctomycetota bacterium]
MNSSIDGLLILGFGGPTPGCCGRRPGCPRSGDGFEAECFVSGILGDNPARAARVAEIAGHYRHFGGYSPYNALTRQQADALAAELARRGRPLPVVCGYRHWAPWAVDGVRELQARGCRSLGLLVMAPHQSSVSWDWYLKHAAEAVEAVGAGAPAIGGVVAPWWNRPGFIAALAARLGEATAGWDAARRAAARLVFTAHAIPQPVEATSPYRRQVEETAALAAAAWGHPQHAVAFQSAPAESRVPWSSPDILAAVRAAHAAGTRELLVQAAGFLVDHTEVQYDLDVEAQQLARELGLGWTRARCVHDHPDFIRTLADGVMAL